MGLQKVGIYRHDDGSEEELFITTPDHAVIVTRWPCPAIETFWCDGCPPQDRVRDEVVEWLNESAPGWYFSVRMRDAKITLANGERDRVGIDIAMFEFQSAAHVVHFALRWL